MKISMLLLFLNLSGALFLRHSVVTANNGYGNGRQWKQRYRENRNVNGVMDRE